MPACRLPRPLAAVLAAVVLVNTAGCSQDGRTAFLNSVQDSESVWSRVIPEAAWPAESQWQQFPVYRIAAELDPAARTLNGKAEILFTNPGTTPLSALHLRTMAKALGPGAGDAFRLSDAAVDGRATQAAVGATLVTFPLPDPLEPGQSVTLTFSFAQRLPEMSEPRGYLQGGAPAGEEPDYRPVIAEFQGVTSDLILVEHPFPLVLQGGRKGVETDALPPSASLYLPDYALYEVDLTLPEEWTVIGNGPVVDQEALGDGRKTVHMATPPVYQFSFLAARGLAQTERQVEGVTIRSFYPDHAETYGQKVADEASQAYALYREALGPLPYPELNYIYLPHLTRSMGAQFGGGFVVLRKDMYSDFKEPTSPYFPEPEMAPILDVDWEANRRRILFHETAHFWWGSSTRPNQLSPWVTEALANAMTYYGLEKAFGPELADWVRGQSTVRYGLMRAVGLPDVPIATDIEEFETISHRTTILYEKGGLFFDALRRELGDDAFFQGLRAHLAQHRYGYGPSEGPVAELRSESGQPEVVERLYQRWVRGAYGDSDIGVLDIQDQGVLAAVRENFGK